jgi:hypothetical protein
MFRPSRQIAKYPLAALAGAAALALTACGGGGGSSGSGGGTLAMSLTDAPTCGYSNVYVTITKLSVNQSSTASATDAGWVDVPITPQRIDLVTLQNGVLAQLGQTPLPAGKYTQMRLLLADNASAGAGQPIPNSVVPTGGSETALTTPSAQQTGLKLNVDIDVAANQLADFVVDFNVCKSIVAAGASGKYLLKPVLSVTPHFVSGVKGSVDASIATGADTMVMLETPGTATQAPVVVKATAPDSTGNFLLEPVAPGTYDLVVTSGGHVTSVVTGVVVSTDTLTTVGGAISPPLSVLADGTLSGQVTPADAMLAVTLTLGSGANAATIEIVGGPADSVTGAYSYKVPVGAVSVAPYATGTLSFTSDLVNAGKYNVSATSGTVTKSSSLLTVGAGLTVTTNFSFP